MNTSQRPPLKYTPIAAAIGWSVLIYALPLATEYSILMLLESGLFMFIVVFLLYPLFVFSPIGIALITIGIYIIERSKGRAISARGYIQTILIAIAVMVSLNLLMWMALVTQM